MKLNIKEVHLKNFLSVGNKWLTIDFRTGLYRVTGENLDNNTKNGVGKSSCWLDSLMFALFGKPLRKIPLTEVANTTNNGKGCEVKLMFSVEDDDYMIHRGIGPGFLRLYENYTKGDEDKKNNKQEKEESAKKFTQMRIDEIIKSSFATFSHLLLMSNSYTQPFLDLEKAKKREVIENILGVTIFGEMSNLAKTTFTDLKNELKVLEKEYELNKKNLEHLKDNREKLLKKAEEFEDKKKEKIENIKDQLRGINEIIAEYDEKILDTEELSQKISKLKKHEKTNTKLLQTLKAELNVHKTMLKERQKTLKELKDNPECPICGTETSSNHVKKHVESLNEVIENLNENIDETLKNIDKHIEIIDSIENKIDQLEKDLVISDSFKNKKQAKQDEKTHLAKQVKEIKSQKNDFSDLIDENELEEKEEEIEKIELKINDFGKEKDYYDYIRKLLSDNGIKNYIIKKILTFWNSKINFYLSELNAEFSLFFDEELNATIKARNRDPLSYHAFSGGEKARIDVAILLSLIDVSKIQNSIDLNVMVIDELLDSGLDNTGREDVLHLFRDLVDKQGKSIYVISHNDNLPLDLFNKEITLYKENGFTHF
jgi:DNA repair exonuclease SbcCD ATPase subunit